MHMMSVVIYRNCSSTQLVVVVYSVGVLGWEFDSKPLYELQRTTGYIGLQSSNEESTQISHMPAL